MGRLFLIDLAGGDLYSCTYCRTPLALVGDLIHKSYVGGRLTTLLFEKVVNVFFGNKEEWISNAVISYHEIYCVKCGELLGLKYESISSDMYKFKQGKFDIRWANILEDYGEDDEDDGEDDEEDDVNEEEDEEDDANEEEDEEDDADEEENVDEEDD
ncbi:unnamed protein product [Lathyrus oleraceus]|uniref:Protein yippee-like n=1 Tax=Pisum sativum TaxID=3888 RepID=A0A9D4XDP7_PEA|nr:hypothetical protein KIW84_042884 [Pisum sativum]